MDVIGIIIGIVYLVKRYNVSHKPSDAFPGVSQEDFEKWKGLELHRLNVFLWIVWPWIIIYLVVVFPVYLHSREENLLLLGMVFLPLLIAAFIASFVIGKQARQMKKSFRERQPAAIVK